MYWKLLSIVLVLLLFAPIALATITSTVYGSHNTQNFRAEADSTRFHVISTTPVSFGMSDGNLIPLPCQLTGSVYECIQTFPADTRPAGIESYTITATDEEYEGSFVIDGVGPHVAATITLSGLNLIITYTATDTAFSGSERCSGINRLELSINNNIVNIEQSSNPDDCIVTGQHIYELDGQDAEIDVILRAYDNVENYGENITELTGDFIAPTISSSFQIYNGNDLIERVGLGNTEFDQVVRVELAVTEENLDSVFADLSSLNPSPLYQSYGWMEASCVPEDIGYLCMFSDIVLHPTSGDLRIVVTANDTSGNTMTGESVFNIETISDPGTITYLGPPSDHCVENCYINDEPISYEMHISPGSSFDGRHVYFQLGSIRAGQEQTQAMRCTEGDDWLCISPPIAADNHGQGTTLRVSVAAGSADDYGNLVFGMLENMVTYDSQEPVITSDVVQSIVCPVAGETVTLAVNATEDTPHLFIRANTEAISSNNITEAECVPGAKWECTLSISELLSYPITTTLLLEISDLAGNTVEVEHEISICENYDSVPNVITAISGEAPGPIDRRIVTFKHFRTYLPLSLTVLAGSRVVDTQARCTAKDASGEFNENYIVGSQSVLNGRSSQPVIAFYIGSPDDVDFPDEVNVTCDLEFRIQQGTRVYSSPELETISVIYETENAALGSFDDNTQKKYDSTIDEIRRLSEKIDKKEKVTHLLNGLCGAAEFISMVNGALQTIKSTIYSVLIALNVIPGFGTVVGEGIWSITVNPVLGGFHSAVNTYIWPPGNFFVTTATGWKAPVGNLVKISCYIYSCKLYEANDYVGLVSHFGAIGIGSVLGLTAEDIESRARDRERDSRNDYLIKLLDDRSKEKFKEGLAKARAGMREKARAAARNLNTPASVPPGPITPPTLTPPTLNIPPVPTTGGGQTPSAPTAPAPAPTPAPAPGGSGTTSTGGSNNNAGGQTQSTAEVPPNFWNTVPDSAAPEGLDEAINVWVTSEPLSLAEQISNAEYMPGSMEARLNRHKTTGTFYNRRPRAMSYASNIPMNIMTGYSDNDIPLSGRVTGVTGLNTGDGSTPPSNSRRNIRDFFYSETGDMRADEMLQSVGLVQGDWIINPYKSRHNDALCLPAQVYNLKKEKEIACMYAQCLNQVKQSGQSPEICDTPYAVRQCLYVESAQVKLHGPTNMEDFFEGLTAAIANNLPSIITSIAYQVGCINYYTAAGWALDEELIIGGTHGVGCGLTGTYLGYTEITAMFNSGYWDLPQYQDADLGDHCEGII